MNKEQAGGQLLQLKGRIKQAWGKLTDNDISLYNGNKDEFYGRMKEEYGLTKEQVEKQIKLFGKSAA